MRGDTVAKDKAKITAQLVTNTYASNMHYHSLAKIFSYRVTSNDGKY